MKKVTFKKKSAPTDAKEKKKRKAEHFGKIHKGESITKNPDGSFTAFKRSPDGSTIIETIWPRDKKTSWEIVDGSKPWIIRTNPKGEKNTQYGCNLEKGTLTHCSDGRWYGEYDFGRLGIEIPLTQMTGRMDDKTRREHRHLMFHVDAIHKKDDAASKREIFQLLEQAIRSLDAKPFEQIVGAFKSIEAINQRRSENESVILSIEITANKLGRVPFKGEVRNYHNKPRPISAREPNGFGGRHYESQRWNQILKTIGFDWLPTGKRGKAKKG
jgi:hypothetical protein